MLVIYLVGTRQEQGEQMPAYVENGTIIRGSLPPHRREALQKRAEECLKRAYQWEDWIEAARQHQTASLVHDLTVQVTGCHTA